MGLGINKLICVDLGGDVNTVEEFSICKFFKLEFLFIRIRMNISIRLDSAKFTHRHDFTVKGEDKECSTCRLGNNTRENSWFCTYCYCRAG